MCPRCGTRDDDWRDEGGDEYDPPPFVPVDRRCRGCAFVGAKNEELKQEGRADEDGLQVALVSMKTVLGLPLG